MTSKASKTALLLALLSPVNAYVPIGEGYNPLIQAGLGDAPWNVNETIWPAIMANPDIEKTYPIVGYNTTMPFPDEEIDGWTVSVSVQKSVPAKGNIETDNPDGVFALSLLKTMARDRLAELNDDDGSRTKMLEEDCLNQLSAEGEYEGCLGPIDAASVTGRRVMNMTEMASVIGKKAAADVDWYSGSEIQSAASNVTDRANATSVELIGNLVHILTISWANFEDWKDGVSNNSVGQTLLCPRTVNYTAVSFESGAASGPLALFTLAAFLPLAAVVWLV
ncbi:hypothetical protein EDB80DRAFT_687177 [Ilyonectria destructans]|nr:hypothetical protein EDB80DRAFT_687177 [Ilyonectria destructans]